MTALGADPEDAQWDAKKRGDGSWLVELSFTSAGRLHIAEWVFDPRRRHVLPADDNAARMSLPGTEPLAPAAPRPGEATVTQLAPRLTAGYAAAPQQNGTTGSGADGWARHERPGAARPPVPQPAPPAFPPQARPHAMPTPSAPVTAEPRGEVPRQPIAERSPQPPAPPTPAPPAPVTAEPRGEVLRQPTAERSPQPPTPAPPGPVTAEPWGEVLRQPTAERSPQPPAVPAAEAVTPAAEDDPAQTPAAIPPEPASEQAGRPGRKTARGKRSSVPSWDEIMFGSTRQRD